MSAAPRIWRAAAAAALLALAGCASGPQASPKDPFEPFNRGVYRFNDAVDRAVLKPVATTYRDVVPSPVRSGVTNFFHNLQDGWSVVNNALQFKGEGAVLSALRFGVNTVFGFGGVFDIASEMQIERRSEDFGQTLGHWGVGPGPYLVWPILGPSTLRDTAAMPLDSAGDASNRITDVATRNSVTVLKGVNQRARLLQATKMLDQAALDPYLFTRDAFLQHRRSQVYDGEPPPEDEAAPELAPAASAPTQPVQP